MGRPLKLRYWERAASSRGKWTSTGSSNVAQNKWRRATQWKNINLPKCRNGTCVNQLCSLNKFPNISFQSVDTIKIKFGRICWSNFWVCRSCESISCAFLVAIIKHELNSTELIQFTKNDDHLCVHVNAKGLLRLCLNIYYLPFPCLAYSMTAVVKRKRDATTFTIKLIMRKMMGKLKAGDGWWDELRIVIYY